LPADGRFTFCKAGFARGKTLAFGFKIPVLFGSPSRRACSINSRSLTDSSARNACSLTR
jgi:hypothetical protein